MQEETGPATKIFASLVDGEVLRRLRWRLLLLEKLFQDVARLDLLLAVALVIGAGLLLRTVINLSNVEIPVRIEGPWDKPNFSVAGQEKILEAVKEIGKNLKSKDVEEALKGLLGGGDGQQKVKPRDMLEKLFKKQ